MDNLASTIWIFGQRSKFNFRIVHTGGMANNITAVGSDPIGTKEGKEVVGVNSRVEVERGEELER